MEQETKKKVLRMITYGLYVLTARRGEELAAGTVNWLSQASFQPPLVMTAIRKDSRLYEIIEATGRFAVNILAEGQKDVAASFFKPTKVEGNLINGYEYEPGPKTGAPLLKVTPAWFEAEAKEVVRLGDHAVFVSEVIEVGLRDPAAKPLEMPDTGWFYGG